MLANPHTVLYSSFPLKYNSAFSGLSMDFIKLVMMFQTFCTTKAPGAMGLRVFR